jgi:putative thiamine transport system ATP-binding protein
MSLVLCDVSIHFAGHVLIDRFSVIIKAGETVTLMGASGSGKSSLLAYLAGDLPESLEGAGEVLLEGQSVLNLPPEKRRIGRLFQDDLLFPHMSVLDNVLFGMPRGDRSKRIQKAEAALIEAGLGAMANRLPHTLSGGQRSRAALLRALMAEPQAILLDEPFSKLDMELRANIRRYVFASLKSKGVPALLVTHDQADAPEGGRIFRIQQSGEVTHA